MSTALTEITDNLSIKSPEMNASVGPPVKCGYCGWLIQGCQNIIYHECLQHFDEKNHLLNVDENFVVTLITRSATTEPATTEDHEEPKDVEELLIQAVFARPALYNVKLPVKDRTKLKKYALWLEVSNTLGGKFTPAEAKKKWQYLRDRFVKAKNKELEYKPSGSAAGPANKNSFKYYKQMTFLSDKIQNAKTMSNVDSPQSPDDSGCSTFSPQQSPNFTVVHPGPSSKSSTDAGTDVSETEVESMASPPPTGSHAPSAKKRKTDNKNEELRSALVAALQQPIPQPDPVDAFLVRLGEGLRRLPYRERSILEIKFLSMVMKAEEGINSTQ